MGNTLTFELEQFDKGYYLSWEILTQCMFKVEVTLKAGNTVYFSAKKDNPKVDLQKITFDSIDHTCKETPILTITVPQAKELKQSLSSNAINDQCARKVGYVYSICIEDQTDDDFNDVYINIVGWAKKG